MNSLTAVNREQIVELELDDADHHQNGGPSVKRGLACDDTGQNGGSRRGQPANNGPRYEKDLQYLCTSSNFELNMSLLRRLLFFVPFCF
jgi:hypothetical protein